MKTVTLAFLLWSSIAFCAGQVANFRLVIPRISPPRIDGDITDITWTECSLKDGKVVIDLGNEANSRVDCPRVAYIGYSNQALYLCVINFSQDPGKLISAGPKAFWYGDDIELYIQPAGFAPEVYVQIGITPNGEAGQMCIDGKERNITDVKIASTKSGIRWCCEIAVPFSYLGVPPPKPGDTWRFDIAGKQTEGGWLSWNPTYGGFGNPNRFGFIVFGK